MFRRKASILPIMKADRGSRVRISSEQALHSRNHATSRARQGGGTGDVYQLGPRQPQLRFPHAVAAAAQCARRRYPHRGSNPRTSCLPPAALAAQLLAPCACCSVRSLLLAPTSPLLLALTSPLLEPLRGKAGRCSSSDASPVPSCHSHGSACRRREVCHSRRCCRCLTSAALVGCAASSGGTSLTAAASRRRGGGRRREARQRRRVGGRRQRRRRWRPWVACRSRAELCNPKAKVVGTNLKRKL